MLQNFLFLLNISEYTVAPAADVVTATVVELKNNPIDISNEANHLGFILFFICFFVIVSIVRNRNKLLPSMFNGLYRNKDRHSMFYEAVTNETLNKLILSLQTVLLLSIIFYCYAIQEHLISITKPKEMLLLLGKSSLILIVFFMYKFLSYSIIGAIFFKKETVHQWNDDFFSIISLNGILLFIPTLILFYVKSTLSICNYFIALYLIFNLFFIFYKIKSLFFQRNRYLLYFILYLCAQEIMPLYLLYRGIIYLIAEKDTIWTLL